MYAFEHKRPDRLNNLLATSTFAIIAALSAGLLLTPEIIAGQASADRAPAPAALPQDESLHTAAPHTLTTGSAVNPATAMANGRPTFFLFYPTDMCAYRSCRLPIELEIEVWDHFEDAVDFVVIHTQSIPPEVPAARVPSLPYAMWDVYPLAPFAEWLPTFVETPFGTGLEAPVVLLVNGQMDLVFQADEYPRWRDIERGLVSPASGLVK